MATNRTNIGSKFQNTDIPSEADFKEIFDSFVHKDEDKASFQMVETGTDTEHYVTPALLRTGLQNIGIITGNSFMPHKENFEDSFSGTILPLTYFPIPKSVKVFKNGQLLQEGPDYTVNYDTAQIKFLETVTDRNLEVDYWYKNLSPSPGSGSGAAIDFTSFLHTSGNETKNGLLTFNNTAATSTSGIILKNSGAAAGTTSLDVTNSGAGSGISLQNSSTGTGVKVSNAGVGAAVSVNSEPGSIGDILQVSKNNVVTAKIDNEGNVTAKKFVTSGGTDLKFVKGDGSLDPTTYADDTKVIHKEGNESKDGALTLRHDNGLPEDVLTIIKNNSANCLKLVQNSSSNATTSTFDTTTEDVNRKAISIQKVHVEKAFITHDGNVSGTSFTTLNEKADITDGFLTLGDSTSPVATANHAKLYAKTNGNTDMYVMGSDGVEKKIGGVVDLSGKENTIAPGTTTQYYRGDKSWQTLDKTAVGLANVDNTSDLNKPVSTATQAALNNVLHKTGFATETKNGELVIDSGANNISGLKLPQIPNASNVNTTLTVLTASTDIYKTIGGKNSDAFSGTKAGDLYRTDSEGVTTIYGTNGLFGQSAMPYAIGSDGAVYVMNSLGRTITKTLSGVTTLITTLPVNNIAGSIVVDSNHNLYYATRYAGANENQENSNLSSNIYKITQGGIITTFATTIDQVSYLQIDKNNVLYAKSSLYLDPKIFKISTSGVVTTLVSGGIVGGATLAINSVGTYLYLSNYTDNNSYKIKISDGSVSTIALGSKSQDVTVDGDGNAYFTIYNSSAINKVTPYGEISTIYPGGLANPLVVTNNINDLFVTTTAGVIRVKQGVNNKVLKTTSTGLVVKTTYLEDVPYVKADANGNPFNQVSAATLDSPNFTGVPTAPTAAAGTNTTQLATTAFVQTNIRPYKSYVAKVVQIGTNNPTVKILENNTGLTFTATRAVAGAYVFSFSTAQNADKVVASLTLGGNNNSTEAHTYHLPITNTSVNILTFRTVAGGTTTQDDGLLFEASLEIRIYN